MLAPIDIYSSLPQSGLEINILANEGALYYCQRTVYGDTDDLCCCAVLKASQTILCRSLSLSACAGPLKENHLYLDGNKELAAFQPV